MEHPEFNSLTKQGTPREVAGMIYEAESRQMARQQVAAHGNLLEVRVLAHFPDFDVEFEFDDGTVVHSGRRTGELNIHMLRFGYYGTGPGMAWAFLDECGWHVTYEQISEIRPVTQLTFRDGTMHRETIGPGHEKTEETRAETLQGDPGSPTDVTSVNVVLDETPSHPDAWLVLPKNSKKQGPFTITELTQRFGHLGEASGIRVRNVIDTEWVPCVRIRRSYPELAAAGLFQETKGEPPQPTGEEKLRGQETEKKSSLWHSLGSWLRGWLDSSNRPRPAPQEPEDPTDLDAPCWCQSGKKFKNCHGLVSERVIETVPEGERTDVKNTRAVETPSTPSTLESVTRREVLDDRVPSGLIPETHTVVHNGQSFTFVETHEFRISTNGRHVAYLKRHSSTEGGGCCVSVDGVDQPLVDEVEVFGVDDDGLPSYLATRGGTQPERLYIDAGTEMELPGMSAESLRFSSDGRRYAYVKVHAEGHSICLDGEDGPVHERIDIESSIDNWIVFSPNGERIAYAFAQGDKQVLVIDGQQSKPFDRIEYAWLFSPDSQHTAYYVKDGSRWYYVIDGEPQSGFDYIDDGPIWSPDSRRLMYEAQSGKNESSRQVVVCDGEKSPGYTSVDALAFSDDSSTFIYEVWNGDAKRNEGFVVVDGVPGPAYDMVNNLEFIPGAHEVVYIARQNDRTFLIQGDTQHPGWDSVSDVTLSLNDRSRRIAYIAKEEEDYFVVVDGERQRGLGNPRAIEFSEDGQHYAYIDGDGSGTMRAVIDGTPQKSYEYLGARVGFSADGEHVAYCVRQDEKDFLVLDGIEGPRFDHILGFNGPDRFHGSRLCCIALDGNRLIRVTIG